MSNYLGQVGLRTHVVEIVLIALTNVTRFSLEVGDTIPYVGALEKAK